MAQSGGWGEVNAMAHSADTATVLEVTEENSYKRALVLGGMVSSAQGRSEQTMPCRLSWVSFPYRLYSAHEPKAQLF